MVSRRIVKARERFRQRKSQRKQMIETLNKLQNDDNRIFAEVDIRGKTMRGLLDTGASVSLLGKNCRELITELNLEIPRLKRQGEKSNIVSSIQKRAKRNSILPVPLSATGAVSRYRLLACL